MKGLLGKIAITPCLFEPFRNPPSFVEIRSCLLKLYAVQGDILRKAKRTNLSITESELPILWILTPTLSARMIQGVGATEAGDNWEKGVYFLPLILKTGIVVIHQLPVNEETLWLRVLGKGGTQKRAVEELVELPENNALKENLLEILANWRKNLELRDNLSKEEQEDIMNLSPAYLQQREDWKQEGLTEGRREMIENLLLVRFGKLDEEMKEVIAQLLQLPTEEVTRLLLNLSREELLQRLRTDSMEL